MRKRFWLIGLEKFEVYSLLFEFASLNNVDSLGVADDWVTLREADVSF